MGRDEGLCKKQDDVTLLGGGMQRIYDEVGGERMCDDYNAKVSLCLHKEML